MSRKTITRTLVTLGLSAGIVTISSAPAAAVDNRVATATALRTAPDVLKGGFCLKYFGVGSHVTSIATYCDPIRLVIPS